MTLMGFCQSTWCWGALCNSGLFERCAFAAVGLIHAPPTLQNSFACRWQ